MASENLVTSWAWASQGIGQYEGPHLFSSRIRDICRKNIEDISPEDIQDLSCTLEFLAAISLGELSEGSSIPQEVQKVMGEEAPDSISFARGAFNQKHVRDYMMDNAAMFRSLCMKLDEVPASLQKIYEISEKVRPDRHKWIKQNWTPESRP